MLSGITSSVKRYTIGTAFDPIYSLENGGHVYPDTAPSFGGAATTIRVDVKLKMCEFKVDRKCAPSILRRGGRVITKSDYMSSKLKIEIKILTFMVMYCGHLLNDLEQN